MQELTQKRVDLANEVENRLMVFARVCIANGAEDDDWYAFDTVKVDRADENSQLENCVDVNVWFDEDSGKWKATVYPFEYSRAGEIQTHTETFYKLFQERQRWLNYTTHTQSVHNVANQRLQNTRTKTTITCFALRKTKIVIGLKKLILN